MSVNSNSKYLLFSLILLLLSAAGIYFLYLYLPGLKPSPPVPVSQLFTPSPVSENQAPVATDSGISSPDPSLLPTPTPFIKTYVSESDKFQVQHSSDRQVYTDPESSGLRYTFYKKDGNIAVHVGTDWSWSHPSRVFSDTYLVSNRPAFRYEINTQTIVDFATDALKYTIQCVHSGNQLQKDECEQFIHLFELL